MVDNRFAPAVAVVAQGQSVEFTNFGQVLHDARDGTGLDLFTTGYIEPPETATIGPLPGAGVYRYYCTFHPEMVGRVRVPVRASRTEVPAGSPVTVRWAASRASTGLVFDVQRRRPGSDRFVDWRTRGHRGLGAVLALGAGAVGGPRSRPPAGGRCVLRLVTAETHPGHLTNGQGQRPLHAGLLGSMSVTGEVGGGPVKTGLSAGGTAATPEEGLGGARGSGGVVHHTLQRRSRGG